MNSIVRCEKGESWRECIGRLPGEDGVENSDDEEARRLDRRRYGGLRAAASYIDSLLRLVPQWLTAVISAFGTAITDAFPFS
jgi:hypothetical protein